MPKQRYVRTPESVVVEHGSTVETHANRAEFVVDVIGEASVPQLLSALAGRADRFVKNQGFIDQLRSLNETVIAACVAAKMEVDAMPPLPKNQPKPTSFMGSNIASITAMQQAQMEALMKKWEMEENQRAQNVFAQKIFKGNGL